MKPQIHSDFQVAADLKIREGTPGPGSMLGDSDIEELGSFGERGP